MKSGLQCASYKIRFGAPCHQIQICAVSYKVRVAPTADRARPLARSHRMTLSSPVNRFCSTGLPISPSRRSATRDTRYIGCWTVEGSAIHRVALQRCAHLCASLQAERVASDFYPEPTKMASQPLALPPAHCHEPLSSVPCARSGSARVCESVFPRLGSLMMSALLLMTGMAGP